MTSYEGQARVGQSIEIPIIIDTAGANINAAEVYIKFDSNAAEVKSVAKEGSFFQLWITDEPKYSNDEGEISFVGGLPTPGFSGKGKIGSVLIRPIKQGQFHLTFDSRTRVLLNDGFGTSIPLKLEPIEIKVQ